jgi:hypothetical protein
LPAAPRLLLATGFQYIGRVSLRVVEPVPAARRPCDVDGKPHPGDRRANGVAEPLGAITAGGGQLGAVEPIIIRADHLDGKNLNVRPPHTPAGCETTGAKTAIIRQIGNAVPIATASALVRALFDESQR